MELFQFTLRRVANVYGRPWVPFRYSEYLIIFQYTESEYRSYGSVQVMSPNGVTQLKWDSITVLFYYTAAIGPQIVFGIERPQNTVPKLLITVLALEEYSH